MFLFEDLENSKTILCTGDFRYDIDYPVCRNEWPQLSNKIVKMFADTTYLSTKTALPTQRESISYCIEQLKQHYSEGRTKIICQTYSVGKEKLFVEIAKALKIKFYPTEKQRKATLKLIYKNTYSEYFTDDDDDVGILDSLFSAKKQWYFKSVYSAFK